MIFDATDSHGFLLGEQLAHLPATVTLVTSVAELQSALLDAAALLVPAVPVGVTLTELLRVVHAGGTGLPVVAYTELTSGAARSRALDAGVDYVVTLPVSGPEVLSVVRSLQRRLTPPPADIDGLIPSARAHGRAESSVLDIPSTLRTLVRSAREQDPDLDVKLVARALMDVVLEEL